MEFQYCKLEIFIPESHLPALRRALGEVDAGHIGKYDHCLSFAPVTGCWRALEGRLRHGKAEVDALPYLRTLAARVGGCDGFLRSALALEVFQERGLISMSYHEDQLQLCLNATQGKVNLAECPYLSRLRDHSSEGR